MGTKHIFVTGGVVSSVGKGITGAALALAVGCRRMYREAETGNPFRELVAAVSVGTFTHTVETPFGFQVSISCGMCLPVESAKRRSPPSAFLKSEYLKPGIAVESFTSTGKSLSAFAQL